MFAPFVPYDLTITNGASFTLESLLAHDPQTGLPMLRREYAPPLMAVATTQQDVTYSSIPREQGSDIAALNVTGGAGAYDYTEGKYAFGEGIATEGGLVYPGPAVAVTTVVATDTANGITINTSSAANPTTITTLADHNLITGDAITISGHSLAGVNGTWTVTVTGVASFTIPVLGGGTGGTIALPGLVGVVTASCRHYDSTQSAEVDYIAAGYHVYKWSIANSRWVQTTTSNTPTGGVIVLTDLISFYNGTSRLLLAAFGSANRYRLSANNGQTWANSFDASGNLFVKKWGIQERGVTTPTVLGAVDPDVIYAVTDPDAGVWDAGTRVGYKDTATDIFTSLTTAPITGEVLVGKKLGWRSFDENGDTIVALGPVPVSSGIGAENFSQPVRLGGSIYAPLNDFDIVEYAQGTITTGFGVARAGPRIPEMQAAITALASDGYQFLYAALAGSSGYVMRGQYQDDDKWHWHGSYIKLGQAISRMFTSSHPGASDKNLYLKICPTASPYLPYRALIPRTDLQTDTDARFTTTGFIRFGYMDAGQAHVYKVIAHQILQSVNVDANNYWTPTYRTDDTQAFGGSLGNFTANGQTIYYPQAAYGKRAEFKLTFTGASSTQKPALVALITRVYRRPKRLKVGQLSIMSHALMRNLTGGEDVTMGPQEMSAQFDALMLDISLPLLDFSYNSDQVTFRAEVTNVRQEFMKEAGGTPESLGHVLVFTLTFQELPTTGYASSQTYQGSAL